jgi:hypothetical protein
VRSTDPALSCRTTCTQALALGRQVSFEATPDPGFNFAGWSGGCGGTGTCTISATADLQVAAQFTPIPPPPPGRLAMAVVISGPGTGVVTSLPVGLQCPSTCTATFDSEATVVLSAVAGSGSVFAGWQGGGCSGTGSCEVHLTAPTTVTANFDQHLPATHGLMVSTVGSGAVVSNPAGIDCGTQCAASFAAGTPVALTATPASGSAFAGWSGACSGTGACSITLDGDSSVRATFASLPPQMFLVSVSLGGSGAGRVTSTPAGIDCPGICSARFTVGAAVNLSAMPAAGSTFAGWGGACGGAGGCGVSADASIAASFAAAPHATIIVTPVSAEHPYHLVVPMRVFNFSWVKFAADVRGLSDTRVIWSVQEGDAGGRITQDGTYTYESGLNFATFHVVATAAGDPSVRGTCAVEVVTHAQDLYDYGGTILPKLKLVLIWWGAEEEFFGAVGEFHNFLSEVNGSGWLAVLDQYMRGDKAQVTLAREIFDTSRHPVGSIPDPSGEICRVLDANGLAPDAGTAYALMVATQTMGVDYHSLMNCHGVTSPTIVLQTPPTGVPLDRACNGYMTAADRVLRAFSHELAEVMTDPGGNRDTGWQGIMMADEIADDCVERCVTLSTGSFTLNALLSNAAQACAP